MNTEADVIGRHAKVTVVVLGCLVAALLTVAGVVTWAELRDPEPYDPLHYTNPQTVTSRVRPISGQPATHLNGTVDVTGEKCSDDRVGIEAVISWQPVDPRGSTVQVGESSGTREAGCEVSLFENEIPDEVRMVVMAQHARGVDAPLWVISGAETPTGPDGHEGSTEVWTTEPFAIVS